MVRSSLIPAPVLALLAFAALLALATLLGCSDPTDFLTPVYDACNTVEDCVETATFCEELAVDFAGFTYVNYVCTLGCEAEGPVSADCPRALIGRFGSCYPSSVAGGVNDMLVCFDPCDFDEQCQIGFRCLGAVGLCGADLSSCPVDQNDAICVPGPE